MTTFKQADISVSLGSPVEFYKFTGELGEYFYTSDNEPHTYGGDVYEPANISRSAIEVTATADSIVTNDITLPVTNTLVQLYCLLKMPASLSVEIFRWHRGTDIATQTEKVWSATAVGFKADQKEGVISTQLSLQAYLTLSTNQVICQAQCNHRLYDRFCKVNVADFTWHSTITRIKGVQIFIDTTGIPVSDNNLKLGKIIIDRTGENRVITESVSTRVSVTHEFIDAIIGEPVTVIAGCEKSYTACKDKFNNLVNFGGFKWLPVDNPYQMGI